VLICEECGTTGEGIARCWRAFIVSDDEGAKTPLTAIAIFCPRCAAREFDDKRTRRLPVVDD
jgi:hypothetical protein